MSNRHYPFEGWGLTTDGTSVIILPVVITMLGWLAGPAAAIGAAVLSSLLMLGFAGAEMWGRMPAPPSTHPMLRWVIEVGVFVLTATLINTMVRSYRRRLEEVERLTGDLTRAQAVAHIGSWIYDLVRDRMQLSAETCRIFGVPGPEFRATLDDLKALTKEMASAGQTPWCNGIESGGATGWPATDWMENLVMRQAGVEGYQKWVKGEVKFDSPEFRNAAKYFEDLFFTDENVNGGRAAIAANAGSFDACCCTSLSTGAAMAPPRCAATPQVRSSGR